MSTCRCYCLPLHFCEFCSVNRLVNGFPVFARSIADLIECQEIKVDAVPAICDQCFKPIGCEQSSVNGAARRTCHLYEFFFILSLDFLSMLLKCRPLYNVLKRRSEERRVGKE